MSSTALRAEIAELDRQIEEIEQFESTWSAGARKARRADLLREMQRVSDLEVRERAEAATNVRAAAEALEALYGEAVEKLQAAVEAMEAVQEHRGSTFLPAWRRAERVGAQRPVMPPKFSLRGLKAGAVRDLRYRLTAVLGSDW